MSVQEFIILKNVFLTIGFICCVFTIVIYIKFEINKSWHISKGKRMKNKKEPAYSEKLSENLWESEKLKGLTEKNDSINNNMDSNINASEGVIADVNINANQVISSTETTILPQTVNERSETVQLFSNTVSNTISNTQTAYYKNINVLCDIMYIHTNIRI